MTMIVSNCKCDMRYIFTRLKYAFTNTLDCMNCLLVEHLTFCELL